MSASNRNEMPEEKKKLLRTMLSLTGYVFAAAGATCLLFPSVPTGFLFGDDLDTAFLFGAALMLVGISDIVIAHTLFKEKR